MIENPTLGEVLRQAIEARVTDIHVAMPGIVQEYDPVTQTANIQPALKKKYANGEVVNLPLLTNVPVIHPRSGTAWLHIPLEKDDTVLLIFSERSIDNFMLNGGVQDPDSHRKHHLSDAQAIPGLFPRGKHIPNATSDAVDIASGKSFFRMKKDGKSYLGKSPTEPVPLGNVLKKYHEDVHAALSTLLDVHIAGQHVFITSPGNPSAPNPVEVAKIAQVKATLASLKSSVISSNDFLTDIFFIEKGE